jgi:hypothetical protein
MYIARYHVSNIIHRDIRVCVGVAFRPYHTLLHSMQYRDFI